MSNELQTIPCVDIFSDIDFNCRGKFNPADCLDLSRSIQEHGLLEPILVQPWEKDGFKFRIVAGYRRFFAVSQLLRQPSIICVVKDGLGEVQARMLNLVENLARKDLNILQEAHAIAKILALGAPRDVVCRELGVTVGWLQPRQYLLSLPEEIQEAAATGAIKTTDIRRFYQLRHDQEKQFLLLRKLQSNDIKNEQQKDKILDEVKGVEDRDIRRARKRPEIFEMMDFMRESMRKGEDAVGLGLHTRALAWAAGEITNGELYDSIKEYAVEHGFEFIPMKPEEKA